MTTAMSPIVHALPHDIIREVFKYFSQPFCIRYWYSFPWFLGHISSEWRYVFLSMVPEFWSTIELNMSKMFENGVINPFYSQRSDLFKELVAYFLEIGTDHPFSFQFRYLAGASATSNQRSPDVDFIFRIFDMLIEQSMRWHIVAIEGPTALASRLEHVKHRLPQLNELALQISTPKNNIFYTGAIEDAPSLMRLTLSDVSMWGFPWPNLTSLSLILSGTINCDDVELALSQMHKLEILRLRGQSDIRLVNRDLSQMVVLPQLKHLEIREAMWLRIFETPALEHLAIVFDSPDEPEIVEFFRRSRCPLLHLETQQCSTQILKAIARYIVTVIDLELYFMMDLVETATWLAHFQELPHLQSIRNFTIELFDEELEAMCALVASRGMASRMEKDKQLQSLIVGDFFSRESWFQKLGKTCESFNVRFETI